MPTHSAGQTRPGVVIGQVVCVSVIPFPSATRLMIFRTIYLMLSRSLLCCIELSQMYGPMLKLPFSAFESVVCFNGIGVGFLSAFFTFFFLYSVYDISFLLSTLLTFHFKSAA